MTRSNKKQSIRIPSAGGKQGRGGDQGIKKGGAGAHNWPPEIIEDILLYLPIDFGLVNVGLASRQLASITFQDPSFATRHFTYQRKLSRSPSVWDYLEKVGIKNERPALYTAIVKGHAHIVERLVQDPRVNPSYSDENFVVLACEHNHIDVVKVLIEDDRVKWFADVNNPRQIDSDVWDYKYYGTDNFALRLAAETSQFDIFSLLADDPRTVMSKDIISS
ncbi:hypothetical protein BCR33DRAFT_770183 [Rhizoclosmatium globosum]|uniref:Uncharacterized protein n=1 Tax=Rhizoclosmatium globosum TaxID=329046 RepID=A0A1Y2BRD8_9FUNG|nr:hypothetical protein BCR33DRAFT_770183 [Rhizoclosmatium globosum]|eukprot:ORY36705.1 hypothetical protein BCR33DRAFT_770183 [Rhizoclosmatium globosum]